MKVIHIPVKADVKVKLPNSLVEKLPKKIMLFTTIQFIDQLNDIKKQLKSEVIITKTKHTRFEGQLLGCNIEKFKGDYDAFLYIGDGEFHPKALVMNNNKEVYCYNPFSKKVSIITQKDVQQIIKKRELAKARFITAKEIGVLITTKPGQNQMKKALQLKKKYPKKNFYFLIDNTFNLQSLEDFNFIEMFINTACPRMIDDETRKPIINIEEL
jgi:2-(3-amino-3-carboxypropyl)histidine synthase